MLVLLCSCILSPAACPLGTPQPHVGQAQLCGSSRCLTCPWSPRPVPWGGSPAPRLPSSQHSHKSFRISGNPATPTPTSPGGGAGDATVGGRCGGFFSLPRARGSPPLPFPHSRLQWGLSPTSRLSPLAPFWTVALVHCRVVAYPAGQVWTSLFLAVGPPLSCDLEYPLLPLCLAFLCAAGHGSVQLVRQRPSSSARRLPYLLVCGP